MRTSIFVIQSNHKFERKKMLGSVLYTYRKDNGGAPVPAERKKIL